MSSKASRWIAVAEENLAIARYAASQQYRSTAVQLAQQAAEKAIKAICITRGVPYKKIHSLKTLSQSLQVAGIELDITEDECDLIDSLYLPSKYPEGDDLWDNLASGHTVSSCIDVAQRLLNLARTSSSSDPIVEDEPGTETNA